ncbi:MULTISPECIES: hypothetical protein [Micrococcaceae]|nr:MULTISPECIES: hypothetical protein [Micrococcaceae]
MRKPVAAASLASALLLAGCISPLVETGTQLNSKAPKTIDGYEFVTQ